MSAEWETESAAELADTKESDDKKKRAERNSKICKEADISQRKNVEWGEEKHKMPERPGNRNCLGKLTECIPGNSAAE